MEITSPSEHYDHLAAICDFFEFPLDTDMPIVRWGKCVIPGDITLRSRISEEAGLASRSSRYFESQGGGLVFGEALAFYHLPQNDCSVVVYHELVNMVDVMGRSCGEWSEEFMVMETFRITKLVGIWEYGPRVHILRKHVGLDLLDVEEDEIEEQEE